MTDSRHLKNRQIAISHDVTERASQAYRPSAILDFKINFNGRRTRDMFCINVSIFVKISRTVAEILRFFALSTIE